MAKFGLALFSLCSCAGALLPTNYYNKINSNSRHFMTMTDNQRERISNDNIFFIELGFGNDSHGQSSTKAAVRACRNAIEFNSIPSIKRLIPKVGIFILRFHIQ
jgi:hypothetical protein